MTAQPSDGGALQQDEGPLEQRAHDAESAYPKNDQPEGDAAGGPGEGDAS